MHVNYSLAAASRETTGYPVGPGDFPGESEIARAALTDACILLTGSGPVRRLAERIHSESGWKWGAFQVVDCGATEEVLETELFRVLEFDLWPSISDLPAARLLQPGTLFLEEVGRLSSTAQTRLRDLLAAARSSRSRRRIIASSGVPLLPRVVEGTFDDTLFYRLNVIQFVLPR
jgi:Nif-specific regulatory protein